MYDANDLMMRYNQRRRAEITKTDKTDPLRAGAVLF